MGGLSGDRFRWGWWVLKSRNQKHDQVNHNAKEYVRYEDVGINGVCHQVETHNIVTIGEIHGNKQEYEWLRSPVGTPDFADRVDDVVMEFGNSLYQKSVDHYIAGEDVPRATEPDVPEDGPLQHTLNDSDAAIQEHGRISRQIGFARCTVEIGLELSPSGRAFFCSVCSLP